MCSLLKKKQFKINFEIWGSKSIPISQVEYDANAACPVSAVVWLFVVKKHFYNYN